MNRTRRAALVAGLSTGIGVAAIGWWLLPDRPWTALIVGALVGFVSGLIIYVAAARAGVETRVQPRFPGAPEPADEHDTDGGERSDPSDPSDRDRDGSV